MAYMAAAILALSLFAVLWFVRRNREMQGVLRSCSVFAIPIVLAICGYMIQERISAGTLSKDYVQIAAQILTPPLPANEEERASVIPMRCWALEILELYSPVKLTEQQKSSLITRGIRGGSWDPPGYQPDGWQPKGWKPDSWDQPSNSGCAAPAKGGSK